MANHWEEQFRQLHGYYRRVYSLFRKLGFDHEMATELTQETFLRVIESREDYRGEARWNYLETTARRIAANEFRRRATHKRTGTDVALDEAEDQADLAIEPADNQVRRNEEKKRLYAAIEKLDKKPQTLLRMYLAGLPYREIGQALDMTEKAVKTALRDIRARLRNLVGVELGGLGDDS